MAGFESNIAFDIRLDAPALSKAGFGTALLASEETFLVGFTERARAYASSAEIDADTDLPAATATKAKTAFLQSIKPAQIKIGKLLLGKELWTVSIDDTTDQAWSLNINGTLAGTHTSVAETAIQIATALVAAINIGAFAAQTTLVDGLDGTFTIEWDVGGVPFTVEALPAPDTTETETTPAVTVDTELAAIAAEDGDWFGVSLFSENAQHITDAFSFVESTERLGLFQSDDADILTAVTTDIGSVMKASSFRRSGINRYADNTKDSAWAALTKTLSSDPDVETTTFFAKTLAGVPIDSVNTTEKNNAEGKNVNLYLDLLGAGSFGQGVAADGTFLDLIVTISWLKARLQERVAGVISNLSNLGRKLPYDDSGLAILEAQCRAQLAIGVSAGHFVAGTPAVDMPTLAEIPEADRAARIVRFTLGAEPAGAIHKVSAVGYVTLNLTLVL